jgi:hypothetical protein
VAAGGSGNSAGGKIHNGDSTDLLSSRDGHMSVQVMERDPQAQALLVERIARRLRLRLAPTINENDNTHFHVEAR